MSRLNNLCSRMIKFYRDDPARIQHLIKVHSFAKLIGEEEHLDEKLLYILEAAAYVHDIGIRPAEAKFGRCDGKLQEQEGPAEAEKKSVKKIFKTETGIRIATEMFFPEEFQISDTWA